MPALATLTLVWLGAGQPDTVSAAALSSWAETNGASLETPRRESPAGADPSVAIATRCEGWLEQARDQLQAGDEEAAKGLLAELDQTLRQHPEILQAAWLMAERHRIEARLARRAAPDSAAALERRAEAIEGVRAAPFGETTSTAVGVPNRVRVELVVQGARRHETYWDGALSSDVVSTSAGEHHLVVLRAGRVAWAGWVNALAPGKIEVRVPEVAPCSTEDFDGVAVTGDRLTVPQGVLCPAWVAASAGPKPGSLFVTRCHAEQCQSTITWGLPLAASPDEQRSTKAFLPAWAMWTLGGVGVAAATSLLLWRTGAFDTAREPKIIYDGTNL